MSEVSAGLAPSESCEKESASASPLASGVLLAIFGIPGCTEASSRSLVSAFLSSHGTLLCACL